MSLTVDHLLFGYDDGHRLLAASRQVSAKRILSLLLGATDAAPGSDQDRLLTGLRLPSSGTYALCITWSAPEVPRPGAIWSHVLLLDAGVLGSLDNPMSVAERGIRPNGENLSRYSLPLDLQSQSEVRPAQPELLLRAYKCHLRTEGLPDRRGERPVGGRSGNRHAVAGSVA